MGFKHKRTRLVKTLCHETQEVLTVQVGIPSWIPLGMEQTWADNMVALAFESVDELLGDDDVALQTDSQEG